ncbi:MAG: threonine synthase [Deltaproteobacteria bacterium]|nr:threonine synthase [Deltaproteobacteria bacterium]
MRIDDFPADIRPYLLPSPSGRIVYECLKCGREHGIGELLYTCPDCGGILLLADLEQNRLGEIPGALWQKIFDYRKMLNVSALKGVFLFHEFLAPIIPLDDVIYLGEGHTPIVMANQVLTDMAGTEFYYKYDGLNPSASFKDRGMAAAVSYLNHLVRIKKLDNVLSICASTGDTSAAAALYTARFGGSIRSAVLLPQGKVTPQQLGQPLGSGANVFELPGVFDDCMKVVERLADTFDVALLNSKNAWRILGQESYAFEIAQDFDYKIKDLSLFVPIGNAGNITAVLGGLLKFERFGIIDGLPKIFGVQSTHANPVFNYYAEPPEKRDFKPVIVQQSVAQAAMIGNPVSMPRVIKMVEEYENRAGEARFFVVQVDEQSIIDYMLLANRNGHVVCTQGGESLAGLRQALDSGLLKPGEKAVLNSTSHILKFAEFQNTYFEDNFDQEFEIQAKSELINRPRYIQPEGLSRIPKPGEKLPAEDLEIYVDLTAKEIARLLDLKSKKE